MNTTSTRNEWHRIEQWLIWIIAIGILLFVLVPLAADKAESRSVPRDSRAVTPRTLKLPFTAWNVAEYFSTSLEMSVEKEANGKLVFTNLQGIVAEDFWRIEIWSEADNVLVQFTVGGDYGMTLAREFFESPLFERQETEKLYEMLSDAQNSPVAKLRRFKVTMTYQERANLEMLNIKFAPLLTRD